METEHSPLNTLRVSVVMLLWLTLLTGLLYPALVTGLSELLFPAKRKGSLIVQGDKVIGSHLIGQQFENPAYFWGRPSATAPVPYNGAASSGSNLGPTNPALIQRVQERILALQKAGSNSTESIPVDLVTASASGLDPHISPAAAYWQTPRVAKLRGLDEQKINALIGEHTDQRAFGLLGEPVVNVLELNMALDKLAPLKTGTAQLSAGERTVAAVKSQHE